MKDRVLVFYANQLYADHEYESWRPYKDLRDLPDGSYIRIPPDSVYGKEPVWFRSDFTPVLEADFPKELLVLVLLLT